MSTDSLSPEHQALVTALTEAVADADVDRAAEVLSPLDEATRAAIHQPTLESCRPILRKDWWHRLPAALQQRLEGDPAALMRRWPARAALKFGLGPRPEHGFPTLSERSPTADLALARVLIDRRPPWLCEWLEQLLDDESWGLTWTLVDAIVRAGACPRPTSPHLQTLMAWNWISPPVPPGEPAPQAYDIVLAVPERLDVELWQLVTYEAGSRLWFTETHADEHLKAGREGLATTFDRLIEEGHVRRDRVLDAVLDALVISGDASHRKSLIQFVKRLSPSVAEIDERQDTLRALLATGAGPVVDFGLAQLGRLVRPGHLDVAALADAVEPAFAVPGQATVQRTVKLVAKLVDATDDPEVRERLLTACANGLLHPKAPAAEAVADLLESHTPLPPATHAAVDSARQAATWNLADRLDNLVDDHRGDSPAPPATPAADDLPAGFPPPRAPGPIRPDLEALERITPLADREALIDAASHAAEAIASFDEIERLLDGLARFGTDRSDSFASRVEALAKRLGDEPKSESGGPGLANARVSMRRALADLLRVWLAGRSISVESFYGPPTRGIFGFLACRVHEVRGRLTGARPSGPLLSLPTHADGWIEPSVLVERLSALSPEEAEQALTSADGALALTRLAPGDPGVAAELPGLAGRLVRYALGSDAEADQPDSVGDPRLWLIAARIRDPECAAHELPARLGAVAEALVDPADLRQPASWSWRFKASFGSRPNLVSTPRTEESDAPRPGPLATGEWRPPIAELTDLAYRLPMESNRETAWLIAWMASIWPARVDAVLLCGADAIYYDFDYADARNRPFDAYFEPLANPRCAWPTAAEPLVGLALIARGKVARAAAVDVMIDAFEDGRADPAALGRALGRCLAATEAPLGRATGALEEIARVSSVHEHAVLRMIDGLLDHWGEIPDWSAPNGLPALLRLIHSLAVAQGEAVSEGAKVGLAKIDGGQAGRLARKLLALERIPDTPRRLDARRAAWAAQSDLN